MSHITHKDLSPDQRFVYDEMRSWARRGGRGKQVLTNGGFAGTGKSTLLSVFAAECDLQVAYACLTGRASSVLGKKLREADVGVTSEIGPYAEGHYCGTIHSLIYRPVDPGSGRWERRQSLDRGYDLIVIDEASMVDEDMVSDLEEYGLPILAVGDHGQLPPVRGEGSLMKEPDLRLEKIHRQAEGSPIVKLSRAIREEHRLDMSLADSKRLSFKTKADVKGILDWALKDDPLSTVFLCFTNVSRTWINKTARQGKRLSGKPKKGEPVVCLKNAAPIYNGMRGVLVEDSWRPDSLPEWMLRAKIAFPEDGIPARDYDICGKQFSKNQTLREVDDLREAGVKVSTVAEAGMLFDFAYAMTVHKSQGSQFRNVVVFSDWQHDYEVENTRRLAYTAVTRASERLLVLV